MKPSHVREHIERSLGLNLGEAEAEILYAHLHYILEQNKHINLTSIEEEETALILHIEDSLTACGLLEQEGTGPLIDIGSGGGFPGIPLAVVSKRTTTLVEATAKKAAVLSHFIEKAGLSGQIRTVAKRVEEYTQETMPGFKVATARAVSSLPALMELAAPLLQADGLLVAYKGAPSAEELKKAQAIEQLLGMEIEGTKDLVLSDGNTRRCLVCIRKCGTEQIELPRRTGLAQKRPLQ